MMRGGSERITYWPADRLFVSSFGLCSTSLPDLVRNLISARILTKGTRVELERADNAKTPVVFSAGSILRPARSGENDVLAPFR